MKWIEAIKQLDGVITKWLLIGIIAFMMFLAQGCTFVSKCGEATSALSDDVRAGMRAIAEN